jgi:hypothetical protein
MDIRRGYSTIGCWGRCVVLRKRRLTTDGRQLRNEKKKKPHNLNYNGETMKMNVTVMDRGTYGKKRDTCRILVAKLEIKN